MKQISSKFKSKPNYDLYNKLWYTLDTYLVTRLDYLIYFKYYKLDFIKLNILNAIYEYDYKVFKVLLFLYWDLENYLEDTNCVKNSLIVDSANLYFINIRFKNNIKNYSIFIEQIKTKNPIDLWTNLEDLGMLDEILKYDIYSKISRLNTRHKNSNYISIYKLYKKYNDEIKVQFINVINQTNKIMDSLYYQNIIEELYKEWDLELNKDLTKKYKIKIKELDLELNKLLECIANNK